MADHSGHRGRHRERVLGTLHRSLHTSTDEQLLELTLFAVNSRGDTRPLARELLNRFGGLGGIMSRSPAQLRAQKGVGGNTAFLLSLIGELLRRAENDFSPGSVISDPESAFAYMKPRLIGLARDTVFYAILTGDSRAAKCGVLSGGLGADNLYILGPETVRLHSRSVLLFHAYPEGGPKTDDEEIRRVIEMSKVLSRPGIKLLDFIAFSGEGFISAVQKGLLPVPGPTRSV